MHTYISKYFLIRRVNFDIKIAKKRLCRISPSKNHTNLITKLGLYLGKYYIVRKCVKSPSQITESNQRNLITKLGLYFSKYTVVSDKKFM